MSEEGKSCVSISLRGKTCKARLIELIFDGRDISVRSEPDVPSLLAAIKAAVAELPAKKKALVQPWLEKHIAMLKKLH